MNATLLNDIWHDIFERLDREPDLDGDQCGRIAQKAVCVIEDALDEAIGEVPADEDLNWSAANAIDLDPGRIGQ